MVEDRELIARALQGDHTAFAEIVDRYKSLVSAVCYSGIGDIALSEDAAQEAFINAWRSLSTLRDAGKLRYWLCAIARNTASRTRGKAAGDAVASAAPMELAVGVSSAVPGPHERAVSKETEALVSDALAGIPETYREPLVLFYRSDQSVSEVAAALDLSESAVRQRLVRGRALLRKELAAVVEGTLARTKPTAALTAAVVAALPILAPGTAEAATSGAAALAAGGQSAAGGLRKVVDALIIPLWPVMYVIAGITSIVKAPTPRQKRFWTLYYFAMPAVLVIAGVAVFLGLWGLTPLRKKPLVWSGLAVIFVTGAAGAAWSLRRLKEIQIEEGTYESPAPGVRSWAVFAVLAVVAYGSVAWAIIVGVRRGNVQMTVSAVFIAGIMSAAGINMYRKKGLPGQAVRWLSELMAFANFLLLSKFWDRCIFPGAPEGSTDVLWWGIISGMAVMLVIIEVVTRRFDRALAAQAP